MAARQTITDSAPRRGFGHGFTLIELLIVLGIIVVMAAFAVPTYRFIMGNRSLNSADNIIAAMIGRARSQAISSQQCTGVAFFYNPGTGRSSMTIVAERAPGSTGDEDPYVNYKGWNDGAWNLSVAPTYRLGQEAYASQVDRTENRVVFRRFHALQDHKSTNSTAPELTDPPTDNNYWAMSANNAFYMDLLFEGEIQVLPPGVGVQLINDPKEQDVPDRYVRTGIVLFDGEGRLVSKEITIARNGELGMVVNGTTANTVTDGQEIPVPANPPYSFRSQLGLVLYDQETFGSQGWTEEDMIATANAKPAIGKVNQQELDEEQWLDQNAMQLLFSRHTGTVLRGE